jgi:uncharacterized membrane protein YdjX (TVP38/TMEM64 family)
MTNLTTDEKVVEENPKSGRYAKFSAGALLLIACLTPIAVQKFLFIDPEVIGMVGIPMIILLGFIGSASVVIPVPVLPLVFAGATILNPVGLVVAAAASITAGMAVCYLLGRKGHGRAARVSAKNRANLPGPISTLYGWSSENVGTASFLIAATPNPMFDYAGLVAGAGRLDARRFLAGTFIGKMTQASVIAFLGHTVGERLIAFL